MSKETEKTVFGTRMPACAEVTDTKLSQEFGVVAMTMKCNGNAVTFFRTDFLGPLERVAWDDNEVFSEKGFHETIPNFITDSIANSGGIFIARNFVMTNRDDNKLMTDGGVIKRKMNYEQAATISNFFKIPEMEANLIYGAIYDAMGKWLIATGSLTEEEWLHSPESKEVQNAILDRKCGGIANDSGKTDGSWTIRELFGNIFETEWTNEKYSESAVAREGVPFSDGEANYPARKRYIYAVWMNHPDAVARVMWSFKN